MEKKNVKSSNSRSSAPTDTQTENTDWIATGLLDSKDSLQSFMKPKKFEEAMIYSILTLLSWFLTPLFVLISRMDLDFEPDQSIASTKVIVEKIQALASSERIWTNCLGRPIRNVGTINVEDFVLKMKKTFSRRDVGTSRKGVIKTDASRTRSKHVTMLVGKSSQFVQSLSSELGDSPRSIKRIEMSTGRLYAEDSSKNHGRL
ncbi:uncharacterized protein LOC141720745 [Apium graveolens]|uniref:uncharacterized protein LOC141720745 n=1 Tax=Apium graveolens TaxID=4045 RepID=UPI003D7C11E7